jgi:gas vesicle protein
MNNFLYPAAEKLRAKNITKKVKELQETQYSSVAKLQNYQKEKLKEIISTLKEEKQAYCLCRKNIK